MKKCLLCQEREADKTGSHIVPHFLLKRIDNQIGVKGRDNELGFVIGKLETKSYFGRNVLPEKLEKIYGEVDDELIENNDISRCQID